MSRKESPLTRAIQRTAKNIGRLFFLVLGLAFAAAGIYAQSAFPGRKSDEWSSLLWSIKAVEALVFALPVALFLLLGWILLNGIYWFFRFSKEQGKQN